MAFKIAEAYVEVGAKTQKASANLKTFKSKLAATGRAFETIGRKARLAFLGVTAAISGALVLYAKQEAAEKLLDAALSTTGQSLGVYSNKLREAASEIQALTIYGDEFVLGLMAQGINLGATGANVEELTKKSIGLATALKMDVATAMRYMTLATQGEFTMLRRYIPELRKTEDATKQLEIVTRVAAAGFQQAEAEAKTTGGRFKQMKNIVGDMIEVIGEAFAPALNALTKILKDGIPAIRDWVKQHKLLVAIIGVATASVLGLATALGVAALATKAFGMALAFVSKHPIVTLITMIAALVVAILSAIGVFKSFSGEMDASKDALDDNLEALKGLQGGYDDTAEAAGSAEEAIDALTGSIEDQEEALLTLAEVWDEIRKKMEEAQEVTPEKELQNIREGAKERRKLLKDAFDYERKEIKDRVTKEASDKLKALKEDYEADVKFVNQKVKGVDKQRAALKKLRKDYDAERAKIKENLEIKIKRETEASGLADKYAKTVKKVNEEENRQTKEWAKRQRKKREEEKKDAAAVAGGAAAPGGPPAALTPAQQRVIDAARRRADRLAKARERKVERERRKARRKEEKESEKRTGRLQEIEDKLYREKHGDMAADLRELKQKFKEEYELAKGDVKLRTQLRREYEHDRRAIAKRYLQKGEKEGTVEPEQLPRQERVRRAAERRARFGGGVGVFRTGQAARRVAEITEEQKKAAKDKALESAPVDILKETKIGNEWLKKIHEESKKSDVAKMAP